MKQLYSLNLNLRQAKCGILDSVVEDWLTEGTPGSVENLTIDCGVSTPYYFKREILSQYVLLYPVHNLCVTGVHLDWSWLQCPRLVELRLKLASIPPTVEELAEILASAAKLRWLELRTEVAPRSNNNPVSLAELLSLGTLILYLGMLEQRAVRELLPLLLP
jgi:hypothetical protein